MTDLGGVVCSVTPYFPARPDRKNGDHECCGRVCPPPSHPDAEAKAGQGSARGKHAQSGCGAIRDKRLVAEGLARPVLGQASNGITTSAAAVTIRPSTNCSGLAW